MCMKVKITRGVEVSLHRWNQDKLVWEFTGLLVCLGWGCRPTNSLGSPVAFVQWLPWIHVALSVILTNRPVRRGLRQSFMSAVLHRRSISLLIIFLFLTWGKFDKISHGVGRLDSGIDWPLPTKQHLWVVCVPVSVRCFSPSPFLTHDPSHMSNLQTRKQTNQISFTCVQTTSVFPLFSFLCRSFTQVQVCQRAVEGETLLYCLNGSLCFCVCASHLQTTISCGRKIDSKRLDTNEARAICLMHHCCCRIDETARGTKRFSGWYVTHPLDAAATASKQRDNPAATVSDFDATNILAVGNCNGGITLRVICNLCSSFVLWESSYVCLYRLFLA